MASPSASTNGGIIGVVNKTSFGKNTTTSITASGPTSPALAATQPGTRLINALVVAGGGGGGRWRKILNTITTRYENGEYK